MASAAFGNAAQGAALGAKVGSVVPGVGNAIGAGVGAVLGGLFGKGGTYATDTGYEIAGSLTPRGFEGSIVGLSKNGAAQYRNAATGELNALKGYTAEWWRQNGLTDSDAAIPFSGSIPYDFSLTYKPAEDAIKAAAASKGSGLLDAFRGSTAQIAAPAVSAAAGGSTVTPAGVFPAAAAPRFDWLSLAALFSGAFWVVKNVG